MLLNAVVDYLPSPVDLPPVTGVNPDSMEEETRASSITDPFTALAFKIMVDPFVGRLVFTRVYSGKRPRGSTVFNATNNGRERVGRILRMHANKREELEEAEAGMIVALPGLKATRTGDTLCEEGKPVVLENLVFPEPVILPLRGACHKERQAQAYQGPRGARGRRSDLQGEDRRGNFPDHYFRHGELHLEIIVDRLKREFGVDVKVGRPQVAYREAVRNSSRAEESISASPVDGASTVTWFSRWSLFPRESDSNSRTKLWAAWCPRNILPPCRRALKRP